MKSKIDRKFVKCAEKKSTQQGKEWKKLVGLQDEGKDGLGKEVQQILSRLEVTRPGEEEFGITWLELYTLYKSLGYRCAASQPSSKAKARPSLGAHLKAFKLEVRRIARQNSLRKVKHSSKRGRKKDTP